MTLRHLLGNECFRASREDITFFHQRLVYGAIAIQHDYQTAPSIEGKYVSIFLPAREKIQSAIPVSFCPSLKINLPRTFFNFIQSALLVIVYSNL